MEVNARSRLIMGSAIGVLLTLLPGCASSQSAAGANASDGPIVSASWVRANWQSVIILEASWAKREEAKEYLAGHVPGAIHVNTDDFENGYPRWHLLEPAQLHAAIGKLA